MKCNYAPLLHDLDLVSFIDYETMKNNDVKIRSEYTDVSVIDFFKKKKEFLNYLLDNGVFLSKQYKKYNSIAINNIKKYLEEIELLINEMKVD